MKIERRRRGFERAGRISVHGLSRSPARRRDLEATLLWQRMAGEALARRSSPRGLRRGVLHIEVHDSAWLETIRELAPALVLRMREASPDLPLREIRPALVPHAPTMKARERSRRAPTQGTETSNGPPGTQGLLRARLERLGKRYFDHAAARKAD